MSRFQIKLAGDWKNYEETEDAILKRAFKAGFPHARYTLRETTYVVDFTKMTQENTETGKLRDIRAPHRWKPPAAPIVPKGPTVCVTVPKGAPGTTIHIPHPKDKNQMLAVTVPASARVGQAMLVPVPPLGEASLSPSAPPAPATSAAAEEAVAAKGGTSTGAKAALGLGVVAAAGLGGAAVAGAVLPDAPGGLEEAAREAAESVAEGAEEAVEWVGDAAEGAGDFIMDLF